MPLASDLEKFLAANQSRARDELFDLLRIPSVSARSEHNPDTARAADWVADSLQKIGFIASIYPTKGHPIVVGEWRNAPAGAQTILVYGHYDVQPAEPLELWDSPPFEPTVRDGKIFARGSVDDKGQLFLTSRRSKRISPRVARFPSTSSCSPRARKKLAARIWRRSSRRTKNSSQPTQSSSRIRRCLRPGLPVDSVVAARSGVFPDRRPGPGDRPALGELRRCGDESRDGARPHSRLRCTTPTVHIAIPGFYDKVRDWGEAARKEIKALPFEDNGFREETGSPELFGEKGYSTLERVWMRPDLRGQRPAQRVHR
jgi:hypothetical protein